MQFKEILNRYLADLQTTQKQLAKESGFSPAMINRYCKGSKQPSYNGEDLKILASSLCAIAKDKNIPFPAYDEVYTTLRDSLENMLRVDYDVFLANLNYLLKYLGVKNIELAKGIYSDVSHISKILSGSSHPGNPDNFIYEVSSYLSQRFISSSELNSIARILKLNVEDISSSALLRDELIKYLGSNANVVSDDSIPHFLKYLDDFNLNDYLKAVNFDEIKVPPHLPQIPSKKEYSGLSGIMESELEFMKATVLSKSQKDVILYNDMPIEEIANDPDFPKKYMYGLALILKKGLHIQNIHDVNRPFPEMMIGLESWIPLYMTGQISPYYLPSSTNSIFLHFLKVSGAAALEGKAIASHQEQGEFTLYRSKNDVDHYYHKAEYLLQKALPLMDIYRKENIELYQPVRKNIFTDHNCKIICSNLLIYLSSADLLEKILKRADVNKTDIETIMAFHDETYKTLTDYLENHVLSLSIPEIVEEQFSAYKIGLSLADLFMDYDIMLTYDEYDAYIQNIKKLAAKYPKLHPEFNPAPTFQHINITIVDNKMVIVSKEKSPTVHFVIYHKKMIRAFQNFIPPIVDHS